MTRCRACEYSPRRPPPSTRAQRRDLVSRVRPARVRIRSMHWLVGSITCLSLQLGPVASVSAYRTFADDPDVRAPAHWSSGEMRWNVALPESSTAQLELLSIQEIEEEIAAALVVWSNADCELPQLHLTESTARSAAPSDGQNTVEVVAFNWTERGFPSGQGATTDVQLIRREDGTAIIAEADIYLNFTDYSFVLESPESEQLDLRAVVTHEVLHALGLLHVCEIDGAGGAPICEAHHRESAVFPAYLGESGRIPSSDDLLGLCSLYSANAAGCDSPCPDGTSCTDGECTGATEAVCVSGSPCELGECAVAGAREGSCLPRGSSGVPCERGSDCASGLCVMGDEIAYCTVECRYDDHCAGMQRCAQVGDHQVCAPLTGSAGCAVVASAVFGTRVPRYEWVVSLLALLFIRRRSF